MKSCYLRVLSLVFFAIALGKGTSAQQTVEGEVRSDDVVEEGSQAQSAQSAEPDDENAEEEQQPDEKILARASVRINANVTRIINSIRSATAQAQSAQGTSAKAAAKRAKARILREGLEEFGEVVKSGGTTAGHIGAWFAFTDVIGDQLVQGQPYRDIPFESRLLYLSMILEYSGSDKDPAIFFTQADGEFLQSLREKEFPGSRAVAAATALGMGTLAFAPQYVGLVVEQSLIKATTDKSIAAALALKAKVLPPKPGAVPGTGEWKKFWGKLLNGALGFWFAADVGKKTMDVDRHHDLIYRQLGREGLLVVIEEYEKEVARLEQMLRAGIATEKDKKDLQALTEELLFFQNTLVMADLTTKDIMANYLQAMTKGAVIMGLPTAMGGAIRSYVRSPRGNARVARLPNYVQNKVRRFNETGKPLDCLRAAVALASVGALGGAGGASLSLYFHHKDVLEAELEKE